MYIQVKHNCYIEVRTSKTHIENGTNIFYLSLLSDQVACFD